jgi:hypothetical protein
MARRKKLTSHWPPAGWDVSYEYELCGTVVTSRQFDFRIPNDPDKRKQSARWFKFDYHVFNNNINRGWISGFDPNGGFVAYYIDQVVEVRPHREKKKNNAENIRDRIAAGSPVKKQRKRRSDAGVKRGPRKAT